MLTTEHLTSGATFLLTWHKSHSGESSVAHLFHLAAVALSQLWLLLIIYRGLYLLLSVVTAKLSVFYITKGTARNKYTKFFVRSKVFNIRQKFLLTERGWGFEKVRVHWKCVDWRLESDTRDISHLQSVQNWWTLHTSSCVYSKPFKNQTRRPLKTSNFAVKLVEKIVVYIRTVNL
jgi:hypothetical protein